MAYWCDVMLQKSIKKKQNRTAITEMSDPNGIGVTKSLVLIARELDQPPVYADAFCEGIKNSFEIYANFLHHVNVDRAHHTLEGDHEC